MKAFNKVSMNGERENGDKYKRGIIKATSDKSWFDLFVWERWVMKIVQKQLTTNLWAFCYLYKFIFKHQCLIWTKKIYEKKKMRNL